MKNNTYPCRVVVGLALGILVVFGSLSTVSGGLPPSASVSVTPSCTSYTITVSASGVPPNGTVSYSITATPTSGSPITISDSIVVGNGNTTLTKPLGPLNGAYTFSGSFSTNFANIGQITFSPSSVSCAAPFASSFAKLEITAGPPQGFDLNESFTLGANSNGINPVTENVTLQIGPFSVTIPAGSFKLNPNGRFAFQGVINGVSLDVQIVPLGNNMFTFKAEGTGVDLTGLFNPVTVVLTIGDDTGSTAVTAQLQ
jgi:hypothetical protein